ncbi:MAG: hypothetical protein R2827_02090 [Bdellovibrionales bacterium]
MNQVFSRNFKLALQVERMAEERIKQNDGVDPFRGQKNTFLPFTLT